jgi:hypothetical protein
VLRGRQLAGLATTFPTDSAGSNQRICNVGRETIQAGRELATE